MTTNYIANTAFGFKTDVMKRSLLGEEWGDTAEIIWRHLPEDFKRGLSWEDFLGEDKHPDLISDFLSVAYPSLELVYYGNPFDSNDQNMYMIVVKSTHAKTSGESDVPVDQTVPYRALESLDDTRNLFRDTDYPHWRLWLATA